MHLVLHSQLVSPTSLVKIVIAPRFAASYRISVLTFASIVEQVLSTNLIKRIYFVEKRIREGEKWQKQAPIIPEFIESSIKVEGNSE